VRISAEVSAPVSSPRQYRQLPLVPPPGATEILLVRHGQSEAAVEGQSFVLIDGQGDPALSSDGRIQAEKVCGRLALERIDAVYVTTLSRTAQTAEPLTKALGLEPVVEPDLREVFVGEWEGGLMRQKVAERDPVALRMLEEQRWDVIPGAESASSFSGRVRRAIERIAAAHVDQRVAVFTHGGTISELLSQATGSERFAFIGCDNASISHLFVTPPRWILRRFNDTAHLDEAFTRGLGASPET
jgi:2,3-bisphosphoglycerate-dependent phosphoglycerate mutase